MKKTLTLMLLVSGLFVAAFAREPAKWQTVKNTHFVIYYHNAQDKFIRQLIKEAEDYYIDISEALGLRRYDFWLWEKRAKIYIYDSAEAYFLATGQPSWSAGMVLPQDKVIRAYSAEKDFFKTVLPHEMGHIIFREFVGFNNRAVPVWLDEGVAVYQQQVKSQGLYALCRKAMEEKTFMPMDKLQTLNPFSLKDKEQVQLFYAESFTIVDFLLTRFGKDNFVLFCQRLRDKQDLRSAIAYAYPFRNLQDLGRGWEKYLRDE